MNKKRLCTVLIGLLMIFTLTACSRSGSNIDSNTPIAEMSTKADGSSGSKILVVYFSVAENSEVDVVSSASVTTDDNQAKGLLRVVADDITNATKGDLFSIDTDVEYPSNYDELIDYADKEQKDDARPKLISSIDNLDAYDTVFVGYPTWWYDMPQVMYSFFDEYDLSGKTIVPFNVHNGSRFSGTIATIKELEPDATVIEDGFTVSQNDVESNPQDITKDIEEWVNKLGY